MGEMVVSLSEASVAVICLDGFEEYDWNGRLYVRSREDASFFRSTLELLELMEANYDSLDYPQASTNNRSFSTHIEINRKREKMRRAKKGERRIVLSKEAMEEKRGERATFFVRVQYRQSATWQGQVTWVEENQTSSFQSALELLKLIDSVENGKKRMTI